jgi:acylphosphatase
MSKEDQRVRAHVFVEGSVQGVFFRATTHNMAAALGLAGWVKNCRDGRVEAVFEGKRSDVEEMVGWCHKGPPGAIVSKVDVSHEEPRGESGAFSIKYY